MTELSFSGDLSLQTPTHLPSPERPQIRSFNPEARVLPKRMTKCQKDDALGEKTSQAYWKLACYAIDRAELMLAQGERRERAADAVEGEISIIELNP